MEYNNRWIVRGVTSRWLSPFFKASLLCLSLLVMTVASQAQFLNDIQSIIEQIGALGAYKDICSKGYKIVEDGVQSYKTIKGAEYSLHTTYFASLKSVSPQVSGYLNQSGALTMIQSTVVDLQRFSATVASSVLLFPSEKQYAAALVASLQSEGQKDADMIGMILADGQTAMSDGERIGRLKPVVEGIEQQHRTAENFIDQTDLLLVRRGVMQNDIQTIESLY
jgi:hypothetical protein